MATRAKQINSAYSKEKSKSPQARIQERINKKLTQTTKKPKAKTKQSKVRSTGAIKKRANKMFDSF